MIDETLYEIAFLLFAMVVIAVAGIFIILFRWVILKKRRESLLKRMWPLLLYGIYPFVAVPLLKVEDPDTFLPYIDDETRLAIHFIVSVAGLILIILFYVRKAGKQTETESD